MLMERCLNAPVTEWDDLWNTDNESDHNKMNPTGVDQRLTFLYLILPYF